MNYRLSDDVGYFMFFTFFFLQFLDHTLAAKAELILQRGQTVKLYTSHTIKHGAWLWAQHKI